jgi:hypothetical protein
VSAEDDPALPVYIKKPDLKAIDGFMPFDWN